MKKIKTFALALTILLLTSGCSVGLATSQNTKKMSQAMNLEKFMPNSEQKTEIPAEIITTTTISFTPMQTLKLTSTPTKSPTTAEKTTVTPTQSSTQTPKPTAMPTQLPTPTPKPTATSMPSPTPTPKPTATPTQSPTPTLRPTSTPTKEHIETPVAQGDISLISITSSVSRNEMASVKIKGKPNTEYKIEVYYSTTVSKAAGLERKQSDGEGYVEWTWKVGPNTKAGEHKIVISGGNSKFETIFSTT